MCKIRSPHPDISRSHGPLQHQPLVPSLRSVSSAQKPQAPCTRPDTGPSEALGAVRPGESPSPPVDRCASCGGAVGQARADAPFREGNKGIKGLLAPSGGGVQWGESSPRAPQAVRPRGPGVTRGAEGLPGSRLPVPRGAPAVSSGPALPRPSGRRCCWRDVLGDVTGATPRGPRRDGPSRVLAPAELAEGPVGRQLSRSGRLRPRTPSASVAVESPPVASPAS